MPCPRCGTIARCFVEPGIWECLGGESYVIPAGYSGGPGLTAPWLGPGVIWHPESTGFAACGTRYSVPYEDLTAGEQAQHDRAVVARERAAVDAEVDARLPALVPLVRSGGQRPDTDFFWLGGLIAYWVVGTLVLWFILAASHVASSRDVAIVVASAVFVGFIAHWWLHHARLRAEHRALLEAVERRPVEIAAREAEREELRARLWAERGHEGTSL
jgi:hypothetical protein